ncbi:ras-like GTP-binding protein RYL2 [Trichonephila clavata]|uniref:Ras-like GTP-binding protein RYL2 n=1 Tax=Trichonephila clavata TaxID=2740835 RepID=A0A8X6F265_TRICU|nr:ras-like GTP-binding protein RYL2 [Trichonephila clavata]
MHVFMHFISELKVRLEEPIIICVVGNKVDKHTHRQVGFKEAAEYAMSIGSLYHECSAFNCKGVEGIFLDIAQEIIKQSAKIKERKDRDAAFKEGEIIRVTSTKKRELADSTEERSFLCC